MDASLIEQVLAALGQQTVVAPGTAAVDTVLPRLADGPRHLLRHDQLVGEGEGVLDDHLLPGS